MGNKEVEGGLPIPSPSLIVVPASLYFSYSKILRSGPCHLRNLYRPVNDSDRQMIPKLAGQCSPNWLANDPQIGPQMIPKLVSK